MNRKILVLVTLVGIILLFNSEFVFGQSPIIGYDKVAWGASIETVKKQYPGGEVLPSGIYIQKNIGGGIDERWFYFYQEKLFKVSVGYLRMEEELGEALYNKVVSVFGKFDKHEDTSSEILFRRNFFRYYNRNLTVELEFFTFALGKDDLVNISKTNKGALAGVWRKREGVKFYYSIPSVRYYNPIVVKQIEDAQMKQQRDRIQL